MTLQSVDINFVDSWPPIEQLLLDTLNCNYKNVTNDRWQATFFDIYRICVAQPDSLVGELYSHIKSLVQKHVQQLSKELASGDTRNLLSSYYDRWITFKAAASYFDSLFHYLNAEHLKKIKKPMRADVSNESVCQPGLEIKDLCLYLWNQEMIAPLRQQLVHLLMNEIDADRRGMAVNQTVISGVVHSLAEIESYKKEDTLDLYHQAFEEPFLKSTGDYYRVEAETYRGELNCSDYMKRVLQIIDLETLRCTKFVHSSSKDKVISEIRARMVADHSKFLYKESEIMVASDCWTDLHSMYKLLKPIEGGLKVLIQQVQTRITQVGLDAMKQVASSKNPPRTFVESFIQVYRKHSELIASTFNNDQLFIGALDKACSAIINYRINPQQPCRSPELLAKYCDSLLRKPGKNGYGESAVQSTSTGGKSLSECEIDEKLALSIIVFKYIDDKDIFQKFYSKNMARRLIFSQLHSMEAEESMINKLKQVCGYEFTAKLHRMYTDIGVSNELKESFNRSLRSQDTKLGIGFSIYILQAGSWPLGQSPDTGFVLPEVFANAVKTFENYYYSRFNGRILTWLYHHCTVDMKLCYLRLGAGDSAQDAAEGSKPRPQQYSVSMQTFHAAILLQFENKDELTYRDLAAATQLSEEQLSKHLQGLLEIKILELVGSESGPNAASPVTIKVENPSAPQDGTNQPAPPQPSAFNPDTRIRLNFGFYSDRTKFKITVVQRDSQYQQAREQSESEQTHASIDEDRKLYLQAAVVRVMKSRKSAKHNQLVQEVIGLTKSHFLPSIPMIKKCIEILIEKQYLERGASAADEYKYIA